MKEIQFSRAIYYLVCITLVCFKFFLIGGEEIIARDQSLDDLWQIMAASRGYWFGPEYTHISFVHLPAYSFWIAFVYLLGIPLRLATEILYVSSVIIFIISLCRVGISKWLCLFCFTLILFNPYSYDVFNYALPESIYGSLFLIGLAGIILLWHLRENKNAYLYIGLPTGVVYALLWNLRKENALIAGLFAVVMLFALYIFIRDGVSWLSALKRIVILFMLPIIIVSIMSLTVKLLNFNKFGLFVSTEMDAPGYKAAYKALLRIKPSEPIRFIPVSREVRQMAYSVSPTFKELSSFFEGDAGYRAAAETRRWIGIKDEIAAGWFYWELRNAVASIGQYNTATAGDAFCAKIAAEINQALDLGILPSRPVFTTFLDPYPANYLPYLHVSLRKMWRLFTRNVMPGREQEDPELNPEVRKMFDSATHRRASLVKAEKIIITGWVIRGNYPIKQVLLQKTSGEIIAICDKLLPRPDIVTAYAPKLRHNIPLENAYKLIVAPSVKSLDNLILVFKCEDADVSVPYRSEAVGRSIEFIPTDKKPLLIYGVDKQQLAPVIKVRNILQRFIWLIHGRLVETLSYLGGVAFLTILLLRRYSCFNFSRNLIFILFSFAILSRVALFTLLDASSWPGNQPRYLFPVMPLYSCFLVLLISQSIGCVLDWYKKGNKKGPA